MNELATRNGQRSKAAAVLIAGLLLAAGCSSAPADDAAAKPTEGTSVTTSEAAVVAFAQEFLAPVRSYLEAAVTGGSPPNSVLDPVSASVGGDGAVDIAGLAICLGDAAAAVAPGGAELYELTNEGFVAHPISTGVWVVAYRQVRVVPEELDETSAEALYVGATEGDGLAVLGERGETGGVKDDCINDAITLAAAGEAQLATAQEADSDVLEPGSDVGGTPADAGADTDGDGSEPEFPRRESQPANPADPEPIQSTGSDKIDIIVTDDPSAFECLVYLGQGPEEILDRNKQGYELVANAYLFTAHFSDGASIDIRVHPEVGSLEEAQAQVDLVVTPLGQLPSTLRAGIGRFALRLGDETATASQGEGISMQTQNLAVRLSDNRLEETIFHESVHTSWDSTYSYMRSTEWLAAQEADGRFLTEYGRENPDSEDLAETALYAYAVLHVPDRMGDTADVITQRVPNRIAFIEALLPVGGSLIEPGSGQPNPACA